MPPSPNQNSYFAAQQQRSRLPDVGQVWRWVGRDESGLAVIRSQRGDIVRAWLAGNAAVADAQPVLYVPPGAGEVLGQVQLPTVLPVPGVRIFEEASLPALPVRAALLEFDESFALTGNIFIGLDRPEPALITTIDFAATTIFRAIMRSTGPGLDDWALSLALGPTGGDPTTIRFVTPSGTVNVSKGAGWVPHVFGAWGVWRRQERTDFGDGNIIDIVETESYLASNGALAASGTAELRIQSGITTTDDLRWLSPLQFEVMSASASGFTGGPPVSWLPIWVPGQDAMTKGDLISIAPNSFEVGRTFNPQSFFRSVGYARGLPENPNESQLTIVGDTLYSPFAFIAGTEPGVIKTGEVGFERLFPDGTTEAGFLEAEYYDIDGNRFSPVPGAQAFWPPE